MSDEQQQVKPWEKQNGEPDRWFRRFERFRLMEPVRSIAAVFNEETPKNPEKPRRNPDKDWYEKAKEWRWDERTAAWDEYLDTELEKTIEAEKKKVLRKGFALMHKRVVELNRLSQQLITYANDEEKVWLPDVKAIGNGPNAERVDLVNFNAPLFLTIDKYFKSMAEEVGDRIKKSETAITSLPPDIYEGIGPNDDGVDA